MNVPKVVGFLLTIYSLFESSRAHECQPGYEAHEIEGSEDYECVLVRPPPPAPLAPPREGTVAIEHTDADGCQTKYLPTERGDNTFELTCQDGSALTRINIPTRGVPEIKCCPIKS